MSFLTEEIPNRITATNFIESSTPSCWYGAADGDKELHSRISSAWKSPLHGILSINVLATFIYLQGVLTSTLEVFHLLTHHSPRKFLLIRNLNSPSRIHLIAFSISPSISSPCSIWPPLKKNQITKMSIHLFSQAVNNVLRLRNLSALSPYFLWLSPRPLNYLLLSHPPCWIAVVEAVTKSLNYHRLNHLPSLSNFYPFLDPHLCHNCIFPTQLTDGMLSVNNNLSSLTHHGFINSAW